jgi:hypothetical protein
MTQTATNLRAVGLNDEVTVCDKCGKDELRGTVIVVDADGNEAGRYGTTCVSQILGRRITRQDALKSERYRRAMIIECYRAATRDLAAGNAALAASSRRDAVIFGATPGELAQFDALIGA